MKKAMALIFFGSILIGFGSVAMATASADVNNGPNNPNPGVIYPQAGGKICANHSMQPIPGTGQIYKAACAVGTWGAPAVPKKPEPGTP